MGNHGSAGHREGVALSLRELTANATTGDLVVLTKEEETHYGILLKDKDVSPRTPLLVAMASQPDADGTFGVRLSSAIATIAYDNYPNVSLKRLSRTADVSYQEAKSLASQTPRQSTANGVLVKVFESIGVPMTRPRPFPGGVPSLAAERVVVQPMKPGPLAKNEGAVPFCHDWM